MSESTAATKCKTSMNALNNRHQHQREPSATKYWRQIGDTFITNVKKCHPSIKEPVAISNDGERVAIISCADDDLAIIKVYDLEGIRHREVGDFSGKNKNSFGSSIALSGDGKRLAIGTPNRHVEVYEYKEGTFWEALGQIPDSFTDYVSLSANGSRMALGSAWNGIEVFQCDIDVKRRIIRAIVGETDWGALILDFLGFSWKKIGQTLVEGGVHTTDLSLSADGNTIAVGHALPYDTAFARVFRYSIERKTASMGQRVNQGKWIQLGQNLLGRDLDDLFGSSLSINAKGDILAVTSSQPEFDSGNGYVKVFQLDNNKWNCMGKTLLDINQSKFGSSVCIAPSTNRIAVGSFGEKVHLNIYDYDGKDWVQSD